MTWPFQLRRAVTNRHRHAIEQASRRWRGGRRDGLARTSRKILISTQPVTRSTTARPSRAHSSVRRRRGARGRARRTATALMKRAAAAPRRASSSLACSQAPRRRRPRGPGPPPSRGRASARSSLSLTRRRCSCGRCWPSVLAARFLCCFLTDGFWTGVNGVGSFFLTGVLLAAARMLRTQEFCARASALFLPAAFALLLVS